MRRQFTPGYLLLDVWASALSALFAQQCSIPPGNLWEPAIARELVRAVKNGESRQGVRQRYVVRLGLVGQP